MFSEITNKPVSNKHNYSRLLIHQYDESIYTIHSQRDNETKLLREREKMNTGWETMSLEPHF